MYNYMIALSTQSSLAVLRSFLISRDLLVYLSHSVSDPRCNGFVQSSTAPDLKGDTIPHTCPDIKAL